MMEQNQIETSKSGGSKILILIIILLLILLGVVFYLGFIEKPANTKNENLNTENQTEEVSENEETPIVEETKKVIVVDGVDIKIEDHDYWRSVCKMYIKIPQILNGGENLSSLNQKMIEDIFKKSYCLPEDSSSFESYEEYQKQASQVIRVTYKYKTINNIITIITEFDRKGVNDEAYDGHFSFTYFYDIKNDKELEMYQALPLMGYTLTDIKKVGANSFNDFKVLEGWIDDDTPFKTYIEIENDKIIINYKKWVDKEA